MRRKCESESDILLNTSHRVSPPPKRPWSGSQRWRDLLFAHWPLEPSKLQSMLPPGLQLDTFDQSAWIGVVPFWMDRVQWRGMPAVPGASRFPELNLRTYVREQNTNRAGIYFFTLEASNLLAVVAARTFFRLPYHWAKMSIHEDDGKWFTYRSDRLFSAKPARFHARYRGLGRLTTEPSQPGTLEHFLTERYCFFTHGPHAQLMCGEVHHTPWPLEAAEAEIDLNELPAAYGIHLPSTAPRLHYSRELVVYVWSLQATAGMRFKTLDAVGARPAET